MSESAAYHWNKRWREGVHPTPSCVGLGPHSGFKNCPSSVSYLGWLLVQIQESLIFAPSRKFYKLLRIYKISYFWCSNKIRDGITKFSRNLAKSRLQIDKCQKWRKLVKELELSISRLEMPVDSGPSLSLFWLGILDLPL
jgi:hypothetical protein